jgi:hypothetical protein
MMPARLSDRLPSFGTASQERSHVSQNFFPTLSDDVTERPRPQSPIRRIQPDLLRI